LDSLATQQDEYPDDGWVLPYETFGFYGGFTDNVAVLLGNKTTSNWILCHGCIVKFLDTFPLLKQYFEAGQHPCSGEKPCCDFAWNDDQIQTRYGHNGVWVENERSS